MKCYKTHVENMKYEMGNDAVDVKLRNVICMTADEKMDIAR